MPATPVLTATYCRPSTAYVIGNPVTGDLRPVTGATIRTPRLPPDLAFLFEQRVHRLFMGVSALRGQQSREHFHLPQWVFLLEHYRPQTSGAGPRGPLVHAAMILPQRCAVL